MMWRSRLPGSHDEALLVALAKRLGDVAASITPRAEFRSSLRTSLTMEAATALVPDRSEASAAGARTVRVLPRRRMAIATAVVATALGMGGITSASASALPGESLYPVKRAAEQVELAFHRDLADRGAFKLELAERRLGEARELSERGGSDSHDLAAASVREFEEAAADGTADLVEAFRTDNSRSSMVLLTRFAERTDAQLDALASRLPAASIAVVDEARESLDAIDSRSEQLCPSCGDGPDSQPAPADPGGSAEPLPEPDQEVPQPAEPPAAPPPPSTLIPSVGSSTSSDSDDEEDEDDEDEEEDEDTDEPPVLPEEPAPVPTPTPTPSPTPEPTPTPTPTPTPGPEPTEPPDLLGIIPETLEGVGGLLNGALGALDSGQHAQ